MPTRVIRDGCLDSERIDALSEMAEVFYKRLWMIVDDYGRFEYDPVVILARAFPRRVNRYTIEQIQGWIKECCKGENPLVIVYREGRKSFFEIQDFGQRIRLDKEGNETAPSKCPLPPGKTLLDYLPKLAAKCGGLPQNAASRVRSTTTTPSHSTLISSEEGVGETKLPTVVPIRPVSTDESFTEFEALGRSCCMRGSEGPEGDWHRARTIWWPKYSLEERLGAHKGLRERIDSGEYGDPAYVHTVANYFAKRIWDMPLKPRPKARDSPKKTAREEDKARYLKNLENGGGDGETAIL